MHNSNRSKTRHPCHTAYRFFITSRNNANLSCGDCAGNLLVRACTISSLGVTSLRSHSSINLLMRCSGSPNSWIFSTDIVPPSNVGVKGKSSAFSTTALLRRVKSKGCALIENPCPLACCQQGIGACPVRFSCKGNAKRSNLLKNTKTYPPAVVQAKRDA